MPDTFKWVMPLIRLDDPSPGHSYTRSMLPVRRRFATSAWAVYRNGGYEFEIDEDLDEFIKQGAITLYFDMDDGRPTAVRFKDERSQNGSD